MLRLFTSWPDPLPKGRMWMDAQLILSGSATNLFIKFHCETQDEGTMTFVCDAASAFTLLKRFDRRNPMRLSTLRRWCDELSIEPIESRWSS